MVCGFMFSEDKKYVVLIKKIKKSNHPEQNWQDGLLNGVGGHVEHQDTKFFNQLNVEDNLHAMVREFNEEAGVQSEDWCHFLTMGARVGNGWSVDFFRCFVNEDVLFSCKTQEKEKIEIHEVKAIIQFPEKCVENLGWLLLLALDNNPQFTEVKY